MGIEARDPNARIPDSHVLTRLFRNPDHLYNPVFFHAVTRLSQGYMGGHMYHPQILMCKHHRIFFGSGELRIDFRMSGIVTSRQIKRFLIQGICYCRIHLPGHSQPDSLFYILKGSFPRYGGHLADGQRLRIHVLHVYDIDTAGTVLSFRRIFNSIDPDRPSADYLCRILQDTDISNHQRAAFFTDRVIRQGFHCYLRTDSSRITECYAN